jgi:hypothetical protein
MRRVKRRDDYVKSAFVPIPLIKSELTDRIAQGKLLQTAKYICFHAFALRDSYAGSTPVCAFRALRAQLNFHGSGL